MLTSEQIQEINSIIELNETVPNEIIKTLLDAYQTICSTFEDYKKQVLALEEGFGKSLDLLKVEQDATKNLTEVMKNLYIIFNNNSELWKGNASVEEVMGVLKDIVERG